MRILLINPNSRRKFGKGERVSSIIHPLGLAYLAGILKKEQFDVKILDAEALNLADEEIIGYIEKYKPNLVGLGAKTPGIYKVFRIAKKIKEKYPKIKIVLGGPHPTALPDESIEKKFVDFVIVGEGEFTMLELVKELNSKKSFEKINGLFFKKRGKIMKNPRREPITNLDLLPFPVYELLPLNKYISGDSRHKKFVSILTSRGCPGKCLYCNKLVFGNHCFMRSAENLIEEIEFLVKKYGFKEFHIVDDLFTNNRQRVIDFCNLLIKKRIKIEWKCGNGVRVGTIDLELLRIMKKAGCYSISYGVESGNQEILNKMRKGQTLKQIENAVKLTKKVGLDCVCFFIFGNIGENKKTMRETIEFAKKLNPDFALFSVMVPYPGTPIRVIIEKEGRLFEKNWENYDHFVGKAVFEHGELKKETMEDMYKKAYKEFYIRPSYIIKKILKLKTFTQFIKNMQGLSALLRI